MPKFSEDWSGAKDEVKSAVKKDKEAAKFLAAVYKKFDLDLSPKLKIAQNAKTVCDEYEAAYHVKTTADAYREIIKKTKDWPESLESGKETLDESLKKLSAEAEKFLSSTLSSAKSYAKEILNKWPEIRSTTTVLKSLDSAIAKWGKVTGGSYNDIVKKAMNKDVKICIVLIGHLRDQLREIQDESRSNVANGNAENELLVEFLGIMYNTSSSIDGVLDEVKDGLNVKTQGVKERKDKDDVL